MKRKTGKTTNRCQACGKPSGPQRLCYQHLLQELMREQELYNADPQAWLDEVRAANPTGPYPEKFCGKAEEPKHPEVRYVFHDSAK